MKSAGSFLEADARAAIIQKLHSRTFQRDLHSKERSGMRLDWPVKRLHEPDGANGNFRSLRQAWLAPSRRARAARNCLPSLSVKQRR